MYKINDSESENEFWHQNSSFFYGNETEFMKKQIAIIKHTNKR